MFCSPLGSTCRRGERIGDGAPPSDLSLKKAQGFKAQVSTSDRVGIVSRVVKALMTVRK